MFGTAPQDASSSPDEIRRSQLMQQLAGGAAPAQQPQPEQLAAPTATMPPQDATPANIRTPQAAKPLSAQSSVSPTFAQTAQGQTPQAPAAEPLPSIASRADSASPLKSVPLPQIMSREQFGAQYKDPVPSFQEPSLRNRLMHGLFFGMQTFGNPRVGAAAEQRWENDLDRRRQMATPLARQQRADEEYKSYLAGQTAEAKGIQEVAAANKALNPPMVPKDSPEALGANMIQKDLDERGTIRPETWDVATRLFNKGQAAPPQAKTAFELWHQQNPNGTYQDWAAEQQKTTKESSLKPEIVNQIGPEPDPRNYAKGQQDPGYQKAAKDWGESYQKKLQEETAAQGAARGAAFMANRMYSAIDTTQGNRPVYVSGETLKNDTQGRYLTPAGGKEITKEMVVQDIRGSVENVRESLTAMKGGFDPASRAALAASLADPNGTAAQFFQTIPRGSMLDETQQQYVIDLFQLREQAMNLRMVTGMGQGSDQLRRAIVSTLPGASTPDANYANRQLDAIEQVLNRVEKGIGNVPLKPAAGPETHGPLVHPATGQPFRENDTRTNRRTSEVQIFRGGQWQTQPKQ